MAGDSELEQGMTDAGLNEIFKKQVWRKLAALPEEKQYEVLDFIDFLSSEPRFHRCSPFRRDR